MDRNKIDQDYIQLRMSGVRSHSVWSKGHTEGFAAGDCQAEVIWMNTSIHEEPGGVNAKEAAGRHHVQGASLHLLLAGGILIDPCQIRH